MNQNNIILSNETISYSSTVPLCTISFIQNNYARQVHQIKDILWPIVSVTRLQHSFLYHLLLNFQTPMQNGVSAPFWFLVENVISPVKIVNLVLILLCAPLAKTSSLREATVYAVSVKMAFISQRYLGHWHVKNALFNTSSALQEVKSVFMRLWLPNSWIVLIVPLIVPGIVFFY